jgi:hypothetical protein
MYILLDTVYILFETFLCMLKWELFEVAEFGGTPVYPDKHVTTEVQQ